MIIVYSSVFYNNNITSSEQRNIFAFEEYHQPISRHYNTIWPCKMLFRASTDSDVVSETKGTPGTRAVPMRKAVGPQKHEQYEHKAVRTAEGQSDRFLTV